jgi:desulfoferrodoxin (superoxide reductase-like protein)
LYLGQDHTSILDVAAREKILGTGIGSVRHLLGDPHFIIWAEDVHTLEAEAVKRLEFTLSLGLGSIIALWENVRIVYLQP